VRDEPLEPRRIRHPRGAYGWVDLRIVTEGHLRGLGPEAALVYLFLCTVGNRAGISFWGRPRIAQLLHLTPAEIDDALARLIAADLIAANNRIVQVLPVPDGCRRHIVAGQQAAGPGEAQPTSGAKSRGVTHVQEPVELAVTDDEIRAHEVEARARIARFYGTRVPSVTTVRALARSIALQNPGARGDE